MIGFTAWLRPCAIGLALVAWSYAEDAPSSGSAAGEVSQRVGELIEQLCSRDFAAREAADAQLRKLGLASVEALSQAFKDHDDLETRLRIQQIAEFLYFWDKIIGKNGFLGIQHQDAAALFPAQQPRDPRLKADHALFYIRRVIEGTAADKAGLREGDLIISVDGKTVPAGPDLAKNAQNFADLIRTKLPGTVLTFELWRGEQIETLPIEIGHRPPEFYDTAAPEDLQAQYKTAKHDFPSWWEAHFGPWSAPDEHGPQLPSEMFPAREHGESEP